jgi:transglutaminase-like putative cysteine protease
MTTTLQPPSAHPHPPAGFRAQPTPPVRQPQQPPAAPPAEGGGMSFLAALLGAAALIAGSTSLVGIITGSSWVLPVVEVVIVVTLVGIGGRMIRFPWPVTVLIQVLALSIALTALFTTNGYGGVLPNSAAVHEGATLISGAWTQILQNQPPAPSTPELSFLIAVSVGVAAIAVDLLVAVAKAPALVALPLLCLYSVPASMATELLPWYAFVAPAVLYALLLAVVGQRGRRVGSRAGVGLAVNGVVFAAVAAVLSLVIADAVTAVGTEGRLPRTDASSGDIGLSPFTSLSDDLRQSTPQDLLTVKGLPQPDYLRTVALEQWTNNKGFTIGSLTQQGSPGGGLTTTGTVTVTSLHYRDKFLPAFQRTTAISGISGWQYDSALGTYFRSDATNPDVYQVQVDESQPTADTLEADTVTPGGTLTDTDNAPAAVQQMAKQVTSGAASPFDKAEALREWFTNPANGFKYSLQVPKGTTGNLLLDFLQNRTGYCEQYATTMAVMLRTLNIPARVGIGFTQGTQQQDGSYLINSHDAHAWVEVRFDNAGWVRFDPTPLVNGQGGQQGFTAPTSTAAPATGGSTDTVTAEPSGTVLSNAGAKADGDTATETATDTSTDANAAAAANQGSRWWPVALWVLLGVVVVAAALMTPTAVRAGRRRRRLAVAGRGGPGAATAAWAEVEDTAVDFGIGLSPTESARSTANRLARRAHLETPEREKMRALVLRAEREWYATPSTAPAAPGAGDGSGPGGGVATMTRPATDTGGADLVAAVYAVDAALRRQVKRSLVDRLVPRSLRGDMF